MIHFEKTSVLLVCARELYDWHLQPGALEALTPPWEPVRILNESFVLEEHAELTLELSLGPFKLHWIAHHQNIVPERRFDDIQRKGPFKHWHHQHLFEPLSEETTRMRDLIACSLPGSAIADRLLGWAVQKKLRRLFDYRHQQLYDRFGHAKPAFVTNG